MKKLLFVLFSLSIFSLACPSYAQVTEKYLKERIPQTDKRHASFSLALQLLKERKAKVLVETGTARHGDKEFGGDGGSTIILGHWAKQHDAQLYSIDHNSEAIEKAKEVTTPYAEHIHFVQSDSLVSLEKFPVESIDFLYLDSQEYDVNNPKPCQDHHLRELITAYPALHKDSIIMVDDCELPHGGQGKFVIEYLIDNDWQIAHQGYQTILIQSSKKVTTHS